MYPETVSELIWLVIALPLAGVLFNGILGRRLGYKVVRLTGPAFVGLAFAVGVAIFYELHTNHGAALTVPLWTWAAIGDLTININLLVDPLSMVMVMVITGVGFLIHIYATEYMVHHHDGHTDPDRDFTRFFTFLNLFIASMLILVLGDNYLMMFVGWELVGACSYLLIGFWYDRGEEPQEAIEVKDAEPVPMAPLLSPAASGMKAFIVNRVGDVGFALGIFLIWTTFSTLQFSEISGLLQQGRHNTEVVQGAVPWITLLLFIGAMGKSAQIPLYVWLPDAMAGPTPVSALIHAATMVTAGVYMIVRSNFLYSLEAAASVSLLIAIIGAATAFFAGTIALTQVDLKRVLAYSTVSQLGYMFLAVGVGAYTAAVFHLMTHAFFKALLFLGAGSVMHALGDVIDIRRMGGLRKKMPVTFITFIIGGAALAGFPLTAGFFSKDEILAKAFEYHPALWVVGIITAGMTAFYTFRAIFIAFFGQPRDQHLYDHAHESRLPITIPLGILAFLSIFGGLLGLPYLIFEGFGMHVPHLLKEWLYPIYVKIGHHGEAHHMSLTLELVLFATSALVGLASIYLAYYLYVLNPTIPQNLANQYRNLFAMLVNKYQIDELYDTIFVKPLTGLSDSFARGVDVVIIDKGLVDGLANLVGFVGKQASRLQTGYISQYALATFVGVLFITAYFIFG